VATALEEFIIVTYHVNRMKFGRENEYGHDEFHRTARRSSVTTYFAKIVVFS